MAITCYMITKSNDYTSIFRDNVSFGSHYTNQIYCFYGYITKCSTHKFVGILYVRDGKIKMTT